MYSFEIEPLWSLLKTLIRYVFLSHSLTDVKSNRELGGKGQTSDESALSSPLKATSDLAGTFVV